jgi:hypothetical protein
MIVPQPRPPKKARSARDASRRLAAAFESLKGQDARLTVAELCRVAKVSRNSLYRYHAPILKLLRERQKLGPRAAQRKVRLSVARHRVMNHDLKQKVSKLATLVDHYYSAYHEAAKLLARRDRELAQVRRQLAAKPLLLPARR